MKHNRTGLLFLILAIAVAVLFCLDVIVGSVTFHPADILHVLFNGDAAAIGTTGLAGNAGGAMADPEIIRTILYNFRIPKALVALMAGAALSASGLQMQTLFRNPLAGPYVLGISSGASLGVALMLLGLPFLGLSAGGDMVRNLGIVGAAWIGSAAVLFMIMAVSVRIKDIMVILILGIMFGSAAGAFVEILQYLSPEGALKSYVIWTMGSVGGVTVRQLYILLPVCAVGLALSVLVIKPLNILLLGENYARTMGLNIVASRTLIFISTTLLAGTVTAFCGPIGFIGIAVPHVARMIFSEADHRVLMPASMLLGSATLLLCDMVSQLPGTDLSLPINTITALLGIPIVIIVIVRNRKVF